MISNTDIECVDMNFTHIGFVHIGNGCASIMFATARHKLNEQTNLWTKENIIKKGQTNLVNGNVNCEQCSVKIQDMIPDKKSLSYLNTLTNLGYLFKVTKIFENDEKTVGTIISWKNNNLTASIFN